MLDKKTFLNKYREITKVLHKRTRVFNHKKILCNKYRKISFIIIAVLVIVNMTIFSFNVFSQMGVQEANSLESYAVVAYTDPGSHTWTVSNGVSSNASAGYGNAGGYGPANWSNTGSAGGGGGAGSVGLTPVG
jgi:hypothetical protein